MISLSEIDKASERFKVPAEVIEKDYVICWVLNFLSMCKIKEHFVFYGGTAIKRVYFEDHRFSEDIDLMSPNQFQRDELTEELESVFRRAKKDVNITLTINQKRIISDGSRIQIFADYDAYEEIAGSPKEIRIDFSMGIQNYGKIQKRKMIASYSDLKNMQGTLQVLELNTILADKLGLLMDSTRREPRDLFDIAFLLTRLGQFDFNVHEVRGVFREKYGYEISLDVLKPHLENRVYKERWEMRLRKQIADLPDIENVIAAIEKKLAAVLHH